MKLLRKGETTPFPAGTKFRIKNNGNIAIILSECPCTDSYLHYLVKWDKGNVATVLHSEEKEGQQIRVTAGLPSI